MSEVKPSQLPPTKTAATLDTMPNNLSASDLVMVTNGSSKNDSQPSEEPPTDLQVNMAWQNNKKFTALWSINENRNAWVYVEGIGWKKLANNSDTAIVALNILASHAKQTSSVVNYNEDDANKMINEMYVW